MQSPESFFQIILTEDWVLIKHTYEVIVKGWNLIFFVTIALSPLSNFTFDYAVNIYLFKANNRNTKKKYEIYV